MRCPPRLSLLVPTIVLVIVAPVFSLVPLQIHAHSRTSSSNRLSSGRTDVHQSSAPTELDASSLEVPLLNGLTKMNNLMGAEIFQSYTNSVAVRESSILDAGQGLFATRNIKAGTVVSFYPAHALGIELGDRQLWVSSNESDQKYFAKHQPGSSAFLHATDQPIFNRPSLLADIPELRDAPIYLDVNPNREVEPLWVSQYINDGAMVQSNDEEGVKAYYEQSKRKKNCIHLPYGPSPVMATVATRKIKKGEELLTSYGCVYWLGVLYADDDGNAPDMTGQIEQQIKESADDLFRSMKSVAVYGNQVEALESAYNDL